MNIDIVYLLTRHDLKTISLTYAQFTFTALTCYNEYLY